MSRHSLPRASPDAAQRFVVYLEGPRDREVLRCWARRHSPRLARALAPACVILGGRQPARAARDLRLRRERDSGVRGLVVLDGDAGAGSPPTDQPGLELFTWERRHIESYLLVAPAIRRGLRVRDGRFDEVLREFLPAPDDAEALRLVDAKRLLGPKGPLAQYLGRPISASHVAGAMRSDELGDEVRALLSLLSAGFGVEEQRPAASVASRLRLPK